MIHIGMTHEEAVYDLQHYVSLLISDNHLGYDAYLLRTIILDFFTPEKIEECKKSDLPNYQCYVGEIISRYREENLWQNGIVEYIIKYKRQGETANHI